MPELIITAAALTPTTPKEAEHDHGSNRQGAMR